MARLALSCWLLVAAASFAQEVVYDGTTFPEFQGWQRIQSTPYPADRWIQDGWLYQHTEIAAPGPPEVPEEDFYRWNLNDQAGASPWYLEWVTETDGSQDGFPGVAPAAIAASGLRGIRFHFTIAQDRIRFIDSDLSVFLFDITPGVPHHYRLDLSPELFVFRIDGAIVIDGPSPGPYPTADSFMVFGARAAYGGETTRWDYIRFGAVPEPATVLLVLVGGVIALSGHRQAH